MFHDPYSNEQIKAYRRDPTGRWSPISEPQIGDPWPRGIQAGIAIACAVVLAGWATISWCWHTGNNPFWLYTADIPME